MKLGRAATRNLQVDVERLFAVNSWVCFGSNVLYLGHRFVVIVKSIVSCGYATQVVPTWATHSFRNGWMALSSLKRLLLALAGVFLNQNGLHVGRAFIAPSNMEASKDPIKCRCSWPVIQRRRRFHRGCLLSKAPSGTRWENGSSSSCSFSVSVLFDRKHSCDLPRVAQLLEAGSRSDKKPTG